MHEVLHTLLMHPLRIEGRDPDVWNVAADMVVNSMCDQMARDVNKLTPEKLMERPPDGIFATITPDRTVESLYGQIKADFEKRGNKATIKKDYRPGMHDRAVTVEITLDRDLVTLQLTARMQTKL